MAFLDNHKDLVHLVLGLLASLGATQLGLDHDSLMAALVSITTLVGTAIAGHHYSTAKVGAAEAASIQPKPLDPAQIPAG